MNHPPFRCRYPTVMMGRDSRKQKMFVTPQLTCNVLAGRVRLPGQGGSFLLMYRPFAEGEHIDIFPASESLEPAH
jgi:hypothetical protein